MGEIMTTISAQELAKKEGIGLDALRARWNNLFAENHELFRERWDKNRPIISAQESALRSAKSGGKKSVRKSAPVVKKESAKNAHTEPTEKTGEVPKRSYRKIGLISLTVAPFLASVDNMFHVTRELTNPFSAVCLTVLVCVSAVGFTVANSRHKVAIAVTVATVAFEAFCNLTRIYGGLMTGASGNPTKFVGLVTDIIGTGTHATAVFLGAVTALLISGVQYAAIFEMNKPAPTRIGA